MMLHQNHHTVQDKDMKGMTQVILGYYGNNITPTFSPTPSTEVAPPSIPPRMLNSAVMPTIPRSEESIVANNGGADLEENQDWAQHHFKDFRGAHSHGYMDTMNEQKLKFFVMSAFNKYDTDQSGIFLTISVSSKT
jgi:hypothetical protein